MTQLAVAPLPEVCNDWSGGPVAGMSAGSDQFHDDVQLLHAFCRPQAGGRPPFGRNLHLQAFAGGLTILPPQPPFATPLSSVATSCSFTGDLLLCCPQKWHMSLTSPSCNERECDK